MRTNKLKFQEYSLNEIALFLEHFSTWISQIGYKCLFLNMFLKFLSTCLFRLEMELLHSRAAEINGNYSDDGEGDGIYR